MTLDLLVGSWISAYTRVDALVDRTADSAAYRVVSGDSVPKTLLLRRYSLAAWPIELLAIARETNVYELRAIDALLEVVAPEPEMADFDARLRASGR